MVATAASRPSSAGVDWTIRCCGSWPGSCTKPTSATDRYDEPGAAGLDAICRGLTLVFDDHRTLELTGAIFDGLYEHRRQLLRGDRPG